LKETQERSAGLDLLRIISMLLVVVLHLLGRGGLLENAPLFTMNYQLSWLLESAAYCAVDCYALLTGYFLSASKWRAGSLLRLWMQVFFYSAGITVLFAIFYEQVSAGRMLQACLPVTFSQYWYFTAYFALFCLAPFFNCLLENINRGGLRRLVYTLVLLLSILPTAFGQDPFVTGKGYSFLWLSALYFLGAWLRRCPLRPVRSRIWLALWAGCAVAQMAFRYVAEHLQYRSTGAVGAGGWLLTYSSPLVLAAAICLFQCCKELKVQKPAALNLIRFFAPVSFGVYLVHAQPFIFHRLLNGAMTPLLELSPWLYAPAVLGIALAVFTASSLIDWVRLGLFRLLHLPQLADALGEKIDGLLPNV
jgi:surface polysaccharide O-acyltransferase-like enzyme